MKHIVLALIVGLALGQTPGTSGGRVGLRHVLTWDPVTVDVTGAPETVASYEVALSLPLVDLNTPGATPIALRNVAGTSLPATDFLPTVPHGTTVRAWVRAIDEAGNVSAWSEYLEVTVDLQPPAAPSRPGCRLLGQ